MIISNGVKDLNNLNIKDRKKYRMLLLKEIYQHYFSTNGAGLSVGKAEIEAYIERNLAYKYLVERGLLTKDIRDRVIIFNITPCGIDLVEKETVV